MGGLLSFARDAEEEVKIGERSPSGSSEGRKVSQHVCLDWAGV
jgi:hypothetical protein